MDEPRLPQPVAAEPVTLTVERFTTEADADARARSVAALVVRCGRSPERDTEQGYAVVVP